MRSSQIERICSVTRNNSESSKPAPNGPPVLQSFCETFHAWKLPTSLCSCENANLTTMQHLCKHKSHILCFVVFFFFLILFGTQETISSLWLGANADPVTRRKKLAFVHEVLQSSSSFPHPWSFVKLQQSVHRQYRKTKQITRKILKQKKLQTNIYFSTDFPMRLPWQPKHCGCKREWTALVCNCHILHI